MSTASPPVKPPRPNAVVARAPAKVNAYLGVGGATPEGFHELATVYMALSLYDDVAVWPSRELSVDVNTPSSGVRLDTVPLDRSNLVARAAFALAEHTGNAPNVAIEITKRIPVAAGLAGGSADAAAALVALDALWQTHIPTGELLDIAAELGSDVPFSLQGGIALGTGRGEKLSPVLVPEARYDFVLAVSQGALSTPAVYAEFDRLRGPDVPSPQIPAELLGALRAAQPDLVGHHLANDLQEPAMSLMPGLRQVVQAGHDAGAAGVIVSGSGPTVAMLAADREHALELCVTLAAASGIAGLERAHGPVDGARVVSAGKG